MDSVSATVLVVLILMTSIQIGRSLRILALHGSGGTPAKFERALTCFRESFDKAEIEFLQAPFVKDAGYSWWKMEDGERSYNARELQGLGESLALLDEAVNRNIDSGYDVMIGHSQGAMMAAIWLARSMTSAKDSTLSIAPKVALLSGSSYPQCQTSLLDKASKAECFTKTVHVIGKVDDINPPELAMKLAGVFKGAEILSHPLGHVFPCDQAALSAYGEVMREAGLL